MDIVEFENMRRDSVGERGDRGGGASGGEDCGFVGCAEGGCNLLRDSRGRLEGSGERVAEPIEHGAFRVGDYAGGKLFEGGGGKRVRESARTTG